jgi:hypothetical protein
MYPVKNFPERGAFFRLSFPFIIYYIEMSLFYFLYVTAQKASLSDMWVLPYGHLAMVGLNTVIEIILW